MPPEQQLAFFVSSGILFIGVLSTVLPLLPGTAIVFTGILLHKLWVPEASVSWTFITFALGLTLLAYFFDFISAWWGARRFGATWIGALGALLGGIFGMLFFSLPGLILGPILGAVLFELLNFRSLPEALRSGFGTVVGGIAALLFKGTASLILVLGFYFSIV